MKLWLCGGYCDLEKRYTLKTKKKTLLYQNIIILGLNFRLNNKLNFFYIIT